GRTCRVDPRGIRSAGRQVDPSAQAARVVAGAEKLEFGLDGVVRPGSASGEYLRMSAAVVIRHIIAAGPVGKEAEQRSAPVRQRARIEVVRKKNPRTAEIGVAPGKGCGAATTGEHYICRTGGACRNCNRDL